MWSWTTVLPATRAERVSDMGTEPSVFISYSHVDKEVARAIADGLANAGVRVWIDEGELRAGDSIIERVATAIADVNFVVAIVSVNSVGSGWCQKELSLAITGALNREGVRVLPLRLGDVDMPDSLADTYYLAVDPDDPAAVVDRLLADARDHLPSTDAAVTPQYAKVVSPAKYRLPSVGSRETDEWADVEATGYGTEVVREARRRGVGPSEYMRSGLSGGPSFRARRSDPATICDAGPIRLTGIVREGVGRPRNDGSRGSALYAIPFRLSRTPTAEWAHHLTDTWNHPPEFTTMHRPGIAKVGGDVVTLDGVTIDEVERYHLRTLKLCVDKVNEDIDRHERRQAECAERERLQLAEHEASIDETLGRLGFE